MIRLTALIVMNLFISKTRAKHEYLYNKQPQFVEQKLILSSSLWCDQIHELQEYDFGHALLGYLSQT